MSEQEPEQQPSVIPTLLRIYGMIGAGWLGFILGAILHIAVR